MQKKIPEIILERVESSLPMQERILIVGRPLTTDFEFFSSIVLDLIAPWPFGLREKDLSRPTYVLTETQLFEVTVQSSTEVITQSVLRNKFCHWKQLLLRQQIEAIEVKKNVVTLKISNSNPMRMMLVKDYRERRADSET